MFLMGSNLQNQSYFSFFDPLLSGLAVVEFEVYGLQSTWLSLGGTVLSQ